MVPTSFWQAGDFVTRGGIRHLPNIPTEEVFTAPNPERLGRRDVAFDPLTGCRDPKTAVDRAADLIAGASSSVDGSSQGDREHWAGQARDTLAALSRILDLGAQLVILGSGDPAAEGYLLVRSHHGGGRFRAWIGFNEGLAHRIEAAG